MLSKFWRDNYQFCSMFLMFMKVMKIVLFLFDTLQVALCKRSGKPWFEYKAPPPEYHFGRGICNTRVVGKPCWVITELAMSTGTKSD